jgi:uncharacterized protein YyaL (SSP411 family)
MKRFSFMERAGHPRHGAAGRVFDRPDWIASARRALDHVRTRMWREGRLLATYKDGRAHLAAYLDDYAMLAAALLECWSASTSKPTWTSRARSPSAARTVRGRRGGGFFFTAKDHETLLYRPKPSNDSACPRKRRGGVRSRQACALTGEERYARAALRTVEAFFPLMRSHPGAAGRLHRRSMRSLRRSR